MGPLSVTSPAFKQGEVLPRRFTCDGENVSPALSWGQAPEGTRSLAILCDDPDAPRGVWTHWVLYNLPPTTTSIREGRPQEETLPNGARQGMNDSRKVGYDGPSPPSGPAHRYFFHVYALDAMLKPVKGMTRAQLLQATEGHVLARGELMGKYQRK